MTVDSVVPLSGGWDSVLALCEATAPTRGRRVRAMFVDYGQPYLEAERVASRWAADALKVELDVVHVPLLGIDGEGSFDGRNAMILRHAAERAEENRRLLAEHRKQEEERNRMLALMRENQSL